MDAIDGQETLMPVVLPRELWIEAVGSVPGYASPLGIDGRACHIVFDPARWSRRTWWWGPTRSTTIC